MSEVDISRPDYSALQEYLPESVLHMAKTMGWDATSRLINHIGGVVFSIPGGIRSSGKKHINILLEALTEDEVKILMHNFAGEEIYIPSCKQAKIEWRNKLFLKEVNKIICKGESENMAITICCPKFDICKTLARDLLRKQRKLISDKRNKIKEGESTA